MKGNAGITGASAAASPSPECLVWEAGTATLRIIMLPGAAERMEREAAQAGSRTAQSGGLLLGTVERDAVLVEDVEPVEWPKGPADKRQELEAALARHATARSSRRVVGFYRTHALNELFLNAGDLVLVKRYFPEPASVFVLLKAGPGGRLTTRFFFQQDGLMRSEASEPGFPFGRPASSLKQAPLAEPAAEISGGTARPARRMTRAALYTAAVALTAGASLYLARAPNWPSWPAAGRNAAAEPLSLEVEKRGRDMVLKWDRHSEAVRQARRAVLDVEDGPASKRYDIDLEQLRTGIIYYTPTGTDVRLKLEVYWDADRRAVESVRVLSGTTPPAPGPEPTTVVLPAELIPGQAAPRIRRAPQPARPAPPPALPLRFSPAPRPSAPPATLESPRITEQEQARGRAAVAAGEGIPGLKPSVTVAVPHR